MADFTAVLHKTIGALTDNTPEARARVYDKARAAIESKLTAASPPPTSQLIERQKALLEDAIRDVEAEYAAAEELQETLEPVAPEPTEDTGEAGAAAPVSGPEEDDSWEQDQHSSEGVLGPEHDFVAEAPVVDPRYSGEAPPFDEYPSGRRGIARVFTMLLTVLILGAAAFGAWSYRNDIAQVAGYRSFDAMLGENAEPAVEEAALETDAPAERPADSAQDGESPTGQGAEVGTPPEKFTQRLTPEGREIDEGPAGGQPRLGEGTSIAQATQENDTAPASDNDQGQQPEAALPVGQQAIFYEERTTASQGSAEQGAVVWSVVEESPGNNLPPEPAIRAEATVPAKGLQLKITIRRNVDESLPASHIIELIFLTPDDFEGGGIENVLRVAMKGSEQETGSPLLGIPVKIADGFFLVALNDSPAELETNRLLMRRQSWIDIPIVYKSGRRALITLEKGVPGNQIFQEALDAWNNASSN